MEVIDARIVARGQLCFPQLFRSLRTLQEHRALAGFGRFAGGLDP
jgi:hypothetical protein